MIFLISLWIGFEPTTSWFLNLIYKFITARCSTTELPEHKDNKKIRFLLHFFLKSGFTLEGNRTLSPTLEGSYVTTTPLVFSFRTAGIEPATIRYHT